MKLHINKKDITFISIITLLLITSLTLGILLATYPKKSKDKNIFEQYYDEHVATFKVENANYRNVKEDPHIDFVDGHLYS